MAHIVIVGGSLGGLFAANILYRAGHEVVLLEKSSDTLDGRGAGIVTHTPLVRAVQMAGATVDERFGVIVASRVALDAMGNCSARLALPQVLTSWSRLYQMLRDVLPAGCHHGGVTVDRVQEDQHGVHAHCRDGRVFSGAMLVASDGLRSVIRAQFAPDAIALYAGYVGWRGVCEERVLSRFTRESIFDCFGFGMPAGEQLIGYPVAGALNSTAHGQRRFNFVWYRAAHDAAALQGLLSDADGEYYPLGIPPNKVDWRQVAAMRDAARTLLAPQFAEIIEKTTQPFLQPIFDVASEQIAFGRVVLMGDAAFVARPHVGMGVTKAAQDAMALADSIGRYGASCEAALAYQAQRLPAGQRVVARGRELGSYMQSHHQAGLVRDEMQVLRDTAIELEEAAVT